MDSEYKDYGFSDSQASQAMRYLVPGIFRMAGRVEGLRVLDVGCGNGYLANCFQSAGASKVVGIDLSESGIRQARKAYPGIRFEICSATDDLLQKLGESPFDIVVSTEVIEHLYSPREFIRSCYNALTANGKFICSTPYHGYLKYVVLSLLGKMDSHLTALWDGGHIKFFSRRTLTTIFTEQGFSEVRFLGVGRCPYLWKSMILSGRRSTSETDRTMPFSR